MDVVISLCKIMDEMCPRANGTSYQELITYVVDRAGHDWRYAIDDSKAESTLGFSRSYENFEDGLKQTVAWYLENAAWLKSVQEKQK